MVIQIIDRGEIEIDDTSITYVKQVSEIGDITKIHSSYSWAFKVPKTPENVKLMSLLSLVGSDSNFPYTLAYCNIIDNGFPIVKKGLFIIKSSDKNEYKCYVQDGIIEFIRDISNDTLGNSIDISDLNHTNSVNNIIASMSGGVPYRYLIAYFNGQFLANVGNTTNLASRGLVPFVNCKDLVDRIFDYYGWTYSGTQDFSRLWMSYPSVAGDSEESENSVLLGNRENYVFDAGTAQQTRVIFNSIQSDGNYITPLFSARQEFLINQPARFKIKFNVEGFVNSTFQAGVTQFTRQLNFIGELKLNGKTILTNEGTNGSITEKSIDLIQGDRLTAIVKVLDALSWSTNEFNIENSYLEILTVGQVDFDFASALIDFPTKDFLKELMVRESLTAFADPETKNIEFKSLKDRIIGTKIDWSDKYIERESESYVYENYAQQNILKHKYDSDNEDYSDGILNVDNQNRPSKSILFEGFSQAAERNLATFQSSGSSYNVPVLKMFDVETQVDENDDIIATYKNLSDRFFFVSEKESNKSIYIQGSIVSNIPLASFESYANEVEKFYNDSDNILSSAKTHHISLALSSLDMQLLDLKKVYYFEQEKAYYLINKITYKSNQVSKGEFVKIDLDVSSSGDTGGGGSPSPTPTVQIIWEDTRDTSIREYLGSPIDVIGIGPEIFESIILVKDSAFLGNLPSLKFEINEPGVYEVLMTVIIDGRNQKITSNKLTVLGLNELP